MSARVRRGLLYLALVLLLLLHGDVWLWRDGRIVLGLPAGLAYHVVYCLVVAGVLALVVRHAWPLGSGEEQAGP